MVRTPILINRPFVATPIGTKLCCPSELVLDFLPPPAKGAVLKRRR
ncbi:hypothetical protein [Oxalicibacterium solurbis]